VICSEGDNFLVQEGYWRKDENASEVFQCYYD